MKKNRKYLKCKNTGKVCYSESQAHRQVLKHESIKRYYYCDDCNRYHVTSLGVGLMYEIGLEISQKELNRVNGIGEKVTTEDIDKRIKELTKKK